MVRSRSYLTECVNEKVDGWINGIIKLAKFATTQPQASYALYTFGLKHRWTYYYHPSTTCFPRSIKTIRRCNCKYFSTSFGRTQLPPNRKRNSSPTVRKCGIEANPCNKAPFEYQILKKITAPLVKRIEFQMHEIIISIIIIYH